MGQGRGPTAWIGEGTEGGGGEAGKECLIFGSSVRSVLPIGYMRAWRTDACSHVSREACGSCWGVSHACQHAWLAHAGMHRVVTLLQYSTASDTRQHVSSLRSSVYI